MQKLLYLCSGFVNSLPMKKIFLLCAIVGLLMACKDKNQPEEPQDPVVTTDPQPQPTSEDAMTAYLNNPVAWNGNFIEITNAMLLQPSVDFPSLSYTPQDGTWPIDVTVNYGDSAIGVDGLEHSGIMRIHATGALEAEGSVFTPTFDQFRVYGALLSGTQTITNIGRNTDGNIVFDVTVANGMLNANSEYIYSEHTSRELVAGLDDNGHFLTDPTTHQYSITGQMRMVSTVDTVPGYTVTIDTVPMLVSVGDIYPTGGEMHVALDEPMTFQMNVSGFQGPVAIQYLNLIFKGKTAQGNYGVKMVVTMQMGFFAVNIAILCELNEDGVVPDSIQYELIQ